MTTTHPWYASYPEGVPHTINPDEYTSIVELMDSVAARFPQHPGFVNMKKAMTYAEVVKYSQDLAAYFQGLGLKKGDRIAIMMPNLLQYIVALFAVLRAGFVVVNINPLYTAREVHHTLVDSQAKAIVIVENFAKTLEKALPETSCKHVITTGVGDMLGFPKRWIVNAVVRYVKKMVPAYNLPEAVNFCEALAHGRRRGFEPVEIQNTDTAFLQYTGGTTGVSKGAVLTHRNVLANMAQISAWLSTSFEPAKEVVMTALPLYHIFSLTGTLVFANLASTMVLITNPRDQDALAQTCMDYDYTVMIGVNTLFAAMLNNAKFRSHRFSRLRLTVGGGSQVQQAVAEAWYKQTGCIISEAYGLTECSPAVCANVPNTPWDGSVGVPIPSTEVSIRNDKFEDLGYCRDASEITQKTGEICVRGPQVMQGYWNKPDETAAVMTDGWLHTGDVGYMDAMGKVTITDRMKDLILVSGFNVYPNEIENVIASMPQVLEVGVVGLPSEKTGETVKAVIVKKDPTLTADDVMAHCRKQLTNYKLPRKIVFVNELPKTAVGKVLRRELKSL